MAFSGIDYNATTIPAGTSFTINISNCTDNAVNVVITMGSETVFDCSVDPWDYVSCPITAANGNIVITVIQA